MNILNTKMTKVFLVKATCIMLLILFSFGAYEASAQTPCGNIINTNLGMEFVTPIVDCANPFGPVQNNPNLTIIFDSILLEDGGVYDLANTTGSITLGGSGVQAFSTFGTIYKHQGANYLVVGPTFGNVTFSTPGVYSIYVRENNFMISKTWIQKIKSFFLPTAFAIFGDSTLITFEIREPNPIVEATCCSNVAFLPGLQASRLYQNGAQLWEPTLTTNNKDIESLFMNNDGTSIHSNIVTKDVIDESLGFNIYKNFIAFMDNDMVGTGIIQEWESLPYDWRLSFDEILTSGKVLPDGSISYLESTSTPYLIQELRRLADTSNTGKVTIVAHSNGGLLAEALLQLLENNHDPLLDQIDKLILVGVPQVGTPKAVEGLLHGDETQLGGGLLVNEEYGREFGENMQSAYNLIPSEAYFNTITNPIITFADNVARVSELAHRAGDSISTANGLDTFLLGDDTRVEPAPNDEESPNVLKSNLLTEARNAQSTIFDTWTPPGNLQVTQIAGWGGDTLIGIDYSCAFFTCSSLSTLDRDVRFTTEGDGTVVYPSALFLSQGAYFLNLRDHNSPIRKNRTHADILEVDTLQEMISSLVQNSLDDNNLPDFMSTTKPAESESSMRVILRSPVTMNIYDSEGLHTGPIENTTSDLVYIESNIPNSYYKKIAGHTYMGLDDTDTYTFHLQGDELGTFTLEINTVLHDEVIQSSSFINIPITEKTIGQLTVSATTVSPLTLDIDGDGTTDKVLTQGDGQDDIASIEILSHIIGSMDIQRELKRDLLKKNVKVQKKLHKGRIQKATKELKKIIKKLKKEILRNEKNTNKQEHEHVDEHKHEHKPEHRVQITNENAGKLIEIVQTIMGGMVL